MIRKLTCVTSANWRHYLSSTAAANVASPPPLHTPVVSPADATRSPRQGLRNAPHRLSSATAPFSSPFSGTWVG